MHRESTDFFTAFPLRKMIEHFLDGTVELAIRASELLDLLNGVHHGRMVLIIEVFADLGEGELGQVLAEVHGDLPRKSDLLGIALRFDFTDFEAVVARYEFGDLGG